MTTTFQKRQKEMKRMEKRKMKEEKRVQRKMDKTTPKEGGAEVDPALDPTIDWNHSDDYLTQE
jgi:hypothetical protein